MCIKAKQSARGIFCINLKSFMGPVCHFAAVRRELHNQEINSFQAAPKTRELKKKLSHGKSLKYFRSIKAVCQPLAIVLYKKKLFTSAYKI
jgi:hypothetical protein